MVPWARSQLAIAYDIIDNPGGGLVFASQTIGQVKAAFQEHDPDGYRRQIELLEQAEDCAVRREYQRSRELITETIDLLGQTT